MRASFETIRDRFRHIDATLVEAVCRLGLEGSEGTKLVVRFYPWWEHPRFIAARERNEPWGFCDASSGARDLSVFPIRVRDFRLCERREVVDWRFTDTHPLLWDHEASAQISCNGALDGPALLERVRSRVAAPCRRSIADLLPPRAYPPPFSLGVFPASIFPIIVEELGAMNVPIVAGAAPERHGPIALLLGDDDEDDVDYIIADDFEVEVPEWEHRDEWFEAPEPGASK